MFVPPTFAQLVGNQRPLAPAQPRTARPRPRRRGSRRPLRLTGVATVLALFVLAAWAALAAPPSQASVSSSEQSMDFGSQDLGTIGPARAALIYNEGPGGVLLDSLEFTGPDAEAFEIESEDCTEEVLPVNAHCVIALRFSPTKTGDLAAALEVSSTERPQESVGIWLAGIGVGPQEPPVTLEVMKTGDGFGNVTGGDVEIDCGEACTASVDSGDTVTLTATPAEGSRFVGWNGGGCGTAPTCETRVEVDTTIHAFFGQVSGPPRITPPSPVAKPAIRGRRRVGARLRCGTGQWTGNGPLAFSYAWTRGGRAVANARGSVYRVRRADRGRRIACRVTATGPGGAASSASQPVRIPRR